MRSARALNKNLHRRIIVELLLVERCRNVLVRDRGKVALKANVHLNDLAIIQKRKAVEGLWRRAFDLGGFCREQLGLRLRGGRFALRNLVVPVCERESRSLTDQDGQLAEIRVRRRAQW